jgi:hypothetical protein
MVELAPSTIGCKRGKEQKMQKEMPSCQKQRQRRQLTTTRFPNLMP